MFPILAFMVTMMAVMPHICHAQPPTTGTWPPTLPKLTQGECPVSVNQNQNQNQSDDVREQIREAVDAAELRRQFLQVLQSRRSAEVPLSNDTADPVENPLYQDGARHYDSQHNLSMRSCAKDTNFTTLQSLLHEENYYLFTEAGEQGRVPVLILSLKQDSPQKRPAVVFLHGTGGNKESLRPMLEAYASRGYIAVAIDSRYHGLRAKNSKSYYQDALVSSWEKGDTMPFIFDTAWDLIKLADHLTQQREDVDPNRIGIIGISLGGMHAWFASFVDTRYSVVVPIIGVQGFQWAIDNDKWQERIKSICPVFDAARQDLNKTLIDKDVVKKVWDRIAPGLVSTFDSPYTIPAISPRPLLILSEAVGYHKTSGNPEPGFHPLCSEKDSRNPLQGLDTPVSRATEAYKEANVPDNFKMIAAAGVGHDFSTDMVEEACNWFDRFFKM